MGEDVGNEDLALPIRRQTRQRNKAMCPRGDRVMRMGTNHDLRQLTFVGIADDVAYSRKRRNFLGRALRVTASHDNLATRILAPDAPYRCPRILIRRSRHGACIQHHDFRLPGRVGSLEPALLELALDGSAIRLRSPAAEIFYVKTRHGSFPQSARIL